MMMVSKMNSNRKLVSNPPVNNYKNLLLRKSTLKREHKAPKTLSVLKNNRSKEICSRGPTEQTPLWLSSRRRQRITAPFTWTKLKCKSIMISSRTGDANLR